MRLRLIALVVSVMACLMLQAQTSTSNDVISTMRMGPFKLNTYRTDIEKMLGTKLISIGKNDDIDTVNVKYNNADYVLIFEAEYNEVENKLSGKMKLAAVTSANIAYKTKSGIGLGSTKAQILSAFDKFDLNIYNDYGYKEKKNARDKIQFIELKDFDAGTEILFMTDNRLVTEITVTIYIGD